MLSLPRLMPPASRRRRAAEHSVAETKYSGVRVPHEVGSPRTEQRSLKASGTPWSGPRQRPAAASASSARAALSAPSSSRRMNAWRRLSHFRMRPRLRSTTSTGEIRPARMSSARPTRVSSLIPRRALLALEDGDEACRLLAKRELARQPPDHTGHLCRLRPLLSQLGHEASSLSRLPWQMYDGRDFAARSPRGQPLAMEAVPMLMRRALTTIMALLMALTLAAEPAQAQKKTLVVALNQDPDILDPTPSRTYVGRIIFSQMCEKLYEIDENLRIIPQLAADLPTISDGGKTVTIKLRPGVKFNDGTPMNAESVRYSLDRHLNMKGSNRRSELESVNSIEVVDPLTVRLKLKTPLSPLVAILADRSGMPVSPTAANKLGDKFGTAPVCVGPWQFVERISQD